MNRPKGFEKPTGVKDYLPDTVARLRRIERNVLACMERWGYRQILTPALEFYDTVGVASSTSDGKLFKLLDKKGTTMVLRSDLTAPIARVVASLLKDEPVPMRLSYHANVFRALEEEAGREAEFFQTGGELIGDGSAEADAEVIALAIESLKAAGVEQFKIALGHVGFLNGLLQEVLPDDGEAQHALKSFLLERNYVGYKRAIYQLEISDQEKAELNELLRLRGGQDICEQARSLSHDALAHEALDHLCRIWEVLVDYGVAQHVSIDLTMIGDFSYYTGMTFEGYAAGLGFPVCNGGRYDNLLTQFGRSAPATGFSLKTNRILESVSQQPVEAIKRVLIIYDSVQRKQAFEKARALRQNDGMMVETLKVETSTHVEQWSPLTCKLDDAGKQIYNGIGYDTIIEFLQDGR